MSFKFFSCGRVYGNPGQDQLNQLTLQFINSVVVCLFTYSTNHAYGMEYSSKVNYEYIRLVVIRTSQTLTTCPTVPNRWFDTCGRDIPTQTTCVSNAHNQARN